MKLTNSTFGKWENEKAVSAESKEMPHAVLDNHDNLLTDPVTIRNEYKTEFQHRLREKDTRSGLE